MAKPRHEQGAAADAAVRKVTINRRAGRSSRAANDNTSDAARKLVRIVPLLLAAIMFCWALWSFLFTT